MEPRDDLTPPRGFVLVAFVAWTVLVIGGTVLTVIAGSPLLSVAWGLIAVASTLVIVGGALLAAAGDTRFEFNLPVLWHRHPAPPEPPDLPFSDDEYAQIRKRVPFVGLVRSGYTDTSEIMSDNPAPPPQPSGPVTISGIATSTRPAVDRTTGHRQKA